MVDDMHTSFVFHAYQGQTKSINSFFIKCDFISHFPHVSIYEFPHGKVQFNFSVTHELFSSLFCFHLFYGKYFISLHYELTSI